MNTASPNASDSPDPSADWMDRLLRFDAAEHSGDYIDDAGFTARVMHKLPLVTSALPAWRRPAVAALWVVAGLLLAVALAPSVVDAALRHQSAIPFGLAEAIVPRTGYRNRFRRSGTTRSRALLHGCRNHVAGPA